MRNSSNNEFLLKRGGKLIQKLISPTINSVTNK